MPSWSLEDADEIAAANKYTFYKPSAEIIDLVQPEDFVKLIFIFESSDPEAPRAERMWVVVAKVEANGRFVGRLANQPHWIQGLKMRDEVVFEAKHIINTEKDDDNNVVNRYIARCFVTQRILSDGVKVGYLYREDPDNEEDSGWRFTAGDESDEYMQDANNAAFVSIGAVLSRDDSFVDLLDSPIGSAFVRDEKTGAFEPVSD